MHTARLQYDRIIITGASSGFGEAFAGTLAPHTEELVLIARNEAALRQLAAALEKRHPGLHASVLPCDLADETSLNTLISRLDSLPPGRTLLINNAGAGDYGDFADGRWEKIRSLLRLNVESLTRLCHALIPVMKRNGGDIINLSSLGALLPIPDFAVYAATKAYVSSLSEALRLELREHGIRTRTRRKLSEGSSEIIDALRQGHVSYVINTIDINQHNTRLDGYEIRRTAVENNVTIFTALETVQVLLDVLEEITFGVSTIDAK